MLCPHMELTSADMEHGFDARGQVADPSLRARLSTVFSGLATWTRMLMDAPKMTTPPPAAASLSQEVGADGHNRAAGGNDASFLADL